MKFYYFMVLFLVLFVGIPFAQTDGQISDQNLLEQEDPPNFNINFKAQDLFGEQSQPKFLAQTLRSKEVDPDRTENKSDPVLNDPIAQGYQMPLNPPPNIQKTSLNSTGNPWEYGIVGVMVVGMMSMLWYMVKSDRADRKSLTEAIKSLESSIDAQKQSNNKLSLEMHAFSESLKERMQGVEGKMTELSNIVLERKE